jgi:hypothetical protein
MFRFFPQTVKVVPSRSDTNLRAHYKRAQSGSLGFQSQGRATKGRPFDERIGSRLSTVTILPSRGAVCWAPNAQKTGAADS